MHKQIEAFLTSSRGVTAIEYALLAGLISVLIVVSIGAAGSELRSLFTYVKDRVVQATS